MPPDVFSPFTELEGYPPWQVPVRRHCSLLKSAGSEPSSCLRLVNISQALGVHGGEEGGGGLEGWRWNEEAAIWGK